MFRLFRNRNYLFLWCGQTVSGAGNWINFVGLNLYVLNTFGSGGILGLFMVVRMLPSVLFGSVGGYLADRFDRRKLMLACDAARAVVVLGFLVTDNLYVFFLLGLILSALDKVFLSARGSLLPGIVSKDDLMDANALNEMTHSVITIAGPAIGALLLNYFDFRSILVLDSVTFVVSVVCLFFVRYSSGQIEDNKEQKERKGIVQGFIDEYRTAFGFIFTYSALLLLMSLRFMDAFGSGAYNIALPLYSRVFSSLEVFGYTLSLEKGSAFGWLVGIWALGQFTGSAISRKITKTWNISRENLFSSAIILMALGMGATFHFPGSLFAFLAIFAGGLGDGMSNVIFVTMVMCESPEKIRGKVFGTIFSLIYSSVALGMIVGGWFSDRFPMITVTNWASVLILLGVVVGRLVFLARDRRSSGCTGQVQERS